MIHFYDKILVAIVKLTGPLKAGATLKFKHGEDEFTQTADSIQIEHKEVKTAKKGDEIGIKVNQPVKKNSEVYSV